MTHKEAKQKLKQVYDLIFEIESQWPEGEHPRIDGYRARIAVGVFEDALKHAVFDDETKD